MAIRKKEQGAQETETQELEQEIKQKEQAGQETEAQVPERDEFANLPSPCVYCGPTVRGVARQYTTYMGGIPEPLKEFIREHPAARALIAPTERFAVIRKRLETPGTAEAIVYQKIRAQL